MYRIKFPDPKEGLGIGKAEPQSTLPWTMPWRVVIVGDAAGRILESDMVLDLAAYNKDNLSNAANRLITLPDPSTGSTGNSSAPMGS